MSLHRITAEEIAELLEQRLDRTVEDFGQDLFDTGVLDSLAFVDLLVELETTYGITIALEELDFEQFGTVEGIARYLDGVRRAALAEAG